MKCVIIEIRSKIKYQWNDKMSVIKYLPHYQLHWKLLRNQMTQIYRNNFNANFRFHYLKSFISYNLLIFKAINGAHQTPSYINGANNRTVTF